MYTETNYKTKKALKEAVAAGEVVRCYHPGIQGKMDGQVGLEGPHYPKAHSWYASCQIENGVIVQGTVN